MKLKDGRTLSFGDALYSLENDNEKLKKENEKLRKELARKDEALEFYANKDNYTELHDYKSMHYVPNIGSPLTDQGDRARSALKERVG